MKKINIRNIKALGAAIILTTNLSSCAGNIKDDNSDLLENNETITEIIPNEIENDKKDLTDEEIISHITSDDKPFKLKESFLDENGTLVYQEFGPEFYEIEINGLKYLINADTKKVCLRDYTNLGRLSCLDCLKKENGGTDSEIGYSGYALLAIYNIGDETLFSLYDFDDFTPLLDKCDLSSSSSFKNDIYQMYYISSYDPKYHGHDEENDYTGYIFRVVKDGICYFIDVNDFTKIILSGDFTFYDENTSSTGNATITYYDYSEHKDVLYRSEDLVPTTSDVLQKTLIK